jgi:predicted Zn-dependent protease
LPAARFGSREATAPAERFVYLPSVGLALTLALGLRSLRERFGSVTALGPPIAISALAIPWCWSRNSDWKSDITLWEAQMRAMPGGGDALRLLVYSYLNGNRLDDAVRLCAEHGDEHPSSGRLQINCGIAFSKHDRKQEAEHAFSLAAAAEDSPDAASTYLASLYAGQGRIEEAAEQCDRSIAGAKGSAKRHLRIAFKEMLLYPKDVAHLQTAKHELEAALAEQPSFPEARSRLNRVSATLAELERPWQPRGAP